MRGSEGDVCGARDLVDYQRIITYAIVPLVPHSELAVMLHQNQISLPDHGGCLIARTCQSSRLVHPVSPAVSAKRLHFDWRASCCSKQGKHEQESRHFFFKLFKKKKLFTQGVKNTFVCQFGFALLVHLVAAVRVTI